MGLFSKGKMYKVCIAHYLGESKLVSNSDRRLSAKEKESIVCNLRNIGFNEMDSKSEFFLPSQFYTKIVRNEFKGNVGDLEQEFLFAIGKCLFGREGIVLGVGMGIIANATINTIFYVVPANAKLSQ